MATDVLQTIGKRPDAGDALPGYTRAYRWFHTVTGEGGTCERRFRDRIHFLECLNTWNRQGQGFWVYWEE